MCGRMSDGKDSRLIKTEDGMGYQLERYSLIGIGMMIVGFLISISILTIVWHPSSLSSAGPFTALLFLAMFLTGVSVGIWMVVSGVRTVRMRIYEDGFIPQKTPFRIWLKGESWFVRWDEVRGMKFSGPESVLGGGWACLVRLASQRVVSVGSKSFRDGGLEVLRKLKQVEKRLKKKGLPETF